MSFSLTLKFDSIPPPLNVVLRKHYHQRNQLYKSIYSNVKFLVKGKAPPLPLEKARVEIERHFYRTCDFDGVVGAYKPYVDALIKNGIILDDNWKVLGPWKVNQVFRAKRLGPLSVIKVFSNETEN